MRGTDIEPLLDQMCSEIQARAKLLEIRHFHLIGIHTGGWWLVQALHHRLQYKRPPGMLDISFYRDDFSRIGINPSVRQSDIPWNLDDQHVLLVDDILHTGRTIRAAMNEIFDFGRPASISLAVLVEREGRELPIEAHIVAKHLALKPDQHLKLRGPEPLRLDVTSA